MASPLAYLARRYALGLWFFAIAALGMVEFRRSAYPQGIFMPNAIAWMWLCGSALLAAFAIIAIVRELRASRRDRRGG